LKEFLKPIKPGFLIFQINLVLIFSHHPFGGK